MKDARNTTAKELKVGENVKFVNIPYFTDDLRLSFITEVVKSFDYTKSGKQLTVVFESGRSVGRIGENTLLQPSPQSFWDKITTERGWK